MAVILATDGVGSARAAGADTNDGDRRAGKADEDVDALDDNTEETQDLGRRRVARLPTRRGQLNPYSLGRSTTLTFSVLAQH